MCASGKRSRIARTAGVVNTTSPIWRSRTSRIRIQFHGSMVASSMSITGMSSVIGYTRWHVPHLRAVPFFTRVTGVLQFGHARISSSSGSTAISGIYDTPILLWNNSPMKLVVFVALLGLATPLAASAQPGRANPPAPAPDRVAEAYEQFLRAHLLEDGDDVEGAITAYKRALAADPRGADIAADLAELYLRENRASDARTFAEQAIKIDPNNRDGHRVLGTLFASLASDGQGRGGRAGQTESLNNAIGHLEKAIAPPIVSPDANVRAMLARLYIATDSYDKAIALLTELVKQEPGWQDGPTLLVQAYSAAGRSADAIKWLEEGAGENAAVFGCLAELYGRQRRWTDAVTAYEQALRDATPRTANPLRIGLATALLASGKPAELARARDVLRQAVGGNRVDERPLALLSQAAPATGA